MLQTLLENIGTLVDKDSPSNAALGRKLMAYDRSIDMHVSNLRKSWARAKTAANGSKTALAATCWHIKASSCRCFGAFFVVLVCAIFSHGSRL